MSTLIPEFTLPKDFCADAREAYTIPARFYTHQAAFEHEKRAGVRHQLDLRGAPQRARRTERLHHPRDHR
ncbi:Uncharacterised protein [Serratia marcescens]|uniref:Uncharacterized protein n=1 Tax=Serratia marcescens TaxID=615 RepID=A0A379YL49_SERMA|nr:Uncharacterised protein [Serratia marcescens]